MKFSQLLEAKSQWQRMRHWLQAGWSHGFLPAASLLKDYLLPPANPAQRLIISPAKGQLSGGDSPGGRRDLAAWATWPFYLAFALLMLCVFTLFLHNFIDDSRENLKILGLLVWCLLVWKFGAGPIGRLLERVHISHILALALLIRLAWVLSSGVVQTSDFAGYDQDAWSIANGGNWFGVFRPSGAPIFYAIHYLIFGHVPLAPQISLCFLATLQIFLVYDIAGRTMGDKNSGKIAALVMTFWPEHVIYNNLLCTEVPFATLLLISVWLLWPDARRYAWRIFLAGICLGLAYWVRANAPIFLAAITAFVLLKKFGATSIWGRVRLALGGLAGFALLAAPIAYLNYREAGIFSAIPSQQSGYNLLLGTSVAGRGHWNEDDIDLLKAEISRRVRPAGMNLFVFRNQIAGEIGLKRLKQQPLSILRTAAYYKIPELWGSPAALVWSLETARLKFGRGTICYLAVLYQVLVVALCGWVVLRHRRLFIVLDERWIYIFAVLLATMSHVILEVQGRYHHGYLPIFAICIGAYASGLSTRKALNRKLYSTSGPGETSLARLKQAA